MFACAGLVAFCTAAQALTQDSKFDAAGGTPYQGIVERNVFGLKPPPPPPDPNDIPKAPAPKIILNGITTLFGVPRALLKVPAQPGKAGDPGKAEQSSILRVGERDGELEVVSINTDPKDEKVEVTYNGQPITVTFDKDAGKIASGPAPVGMPQHPGGMIPAPIGLPARFPSSSPGFSMPARPIRGYQQQGAASMPGASPVANGYSGGTSMPGFGAPASTYNATQPGQLQGQQLSPEESTIMIEAERERLQQVGSPLANLMPITRATPAGAPGTLEQPNPAAGNAGTPGQGAQRPFMPPLPPGRTPPMMLPQ